MNIKDIYFKIEFCILLILMSPVIVVFAIFVGILSVALLTSFIWFPLGIIWIFMKLTGQI